MRTGAEGSVSIRKFELTLNLPAMPVKGESRKETKEMTVGPAGFSLLNFRAPDDAAVCRPLLEDALNCEATVRRYRGDEWSRALYLVTW